MASPNLSAVLATTLAHYSRTIADNVTDNNAILYKLKQRGKVRTFDGGERIYEQVSFDGNTNAGWYSGFDILPTAASEEITAAEFTMKQCSVPVVISGLDKLRNSGRAKLQDLMKSKIQVAEATMANLISEGLYSDGTGYGGKQIVGLDAAVPVDPTTGTYGGINRANWTFWQSQLVDPAATPTSTTIQASMNELWAECCRGNDKPDLIMAGGTIWATFMASLQAQQRFSDTKMADAGFQNVLFMGAPVVLDGGIGGYASATTMYFLNTNYLHYRPHADRDMVPLDSRSPVNQDAEIQILAWAGNLTCSGSRYQGRLIGS